MCQFIYLEFGADATQVTGTEHCVIGAATGPFCACLGILEIQ